ncbi:hypothetical protein SPRG_12163 [Saprolegnia parasitica CBS 223.65]|uniref:Uncharacterized protein n=1 Tax=Saprolegnia parasitica (strain CBS 223.65) TaxID=695850 RepID=A0A067C883_SAPPC|nr:hypothetical protein SPRG_12163 [Saprolegnia parasitica CBS 223.65]KDO22736.1 hypothetical protein SPRG_12163 [Saprolegnia parasitica CBS 223.65]|eukprot:XP_012206524.1 hypothetical protein SPRG_12163 [Saprolegnia parasitica CBS 223.65]
MPGINNPTLVIKSYDNYETDVLPALLDDDGQLLKKVEAKEKFTVDMSAQKCTEALKDAAAVLEIAIAASHGFPCNAKIINLLGRYQTLVVDADIATAAFLTACMQALKYFKTAFACLEKSKIDLVEKMLLATSKIAGEMTAIATKIAIASGKAAEEALTILNTTDVAKSAAQVSKSETDAAVKASKETTSILEKDLEEKTRRVSDAQAAEKTAMSQRNMQGGVNTTDYSVLWGLWKSRTPSAPHASKRSRSSKRPTKRSRKSRSSLQTCT